MRLKQLLVIVLVFSLLSSSAQIHHVEPLNWWVGMKDPRLQLLIHGENIGETTPSIKYPGVKLVKVNKADSKNYLFLDLVIDKTAKAGIVGIEFRKNGRAVYTYRYQLKKRGAGMDKLKGFDASDVIYLVTPDRFVNGDTTNDIIASMRENQIDRNGPGMRHGGDIRGIINRLDYIKDMGFTAIWPQPMVENDMAAYSYHGYAITDHYKVDARYGTMEEYKELADKAAAKGIKLIIDHVVNHTGTGYWWMKDLPFRNWLNYPDSKLRTNHRRTVNQDKYASAYDRDLMIGGWFDGHMADMNTTNPFMAAYLIQNTIWWVETLKLGGIRQDTYSYSNKEFLRNWTCRIMKEYPNLNIVGEEWSLNPATIAYWQKGNKNADGYTSCLKSIMDFPMQHALIAALKEEDDKWGTRGLIKLYESLSNDYVYPDPKNMLVFGDNHDMDRLYTQLGNDAALTRMALTYLLTTRGIPQVYYGTEVLMNNTGFPNDHGVIRSDFPGGWQGDAQDAVSGKGMSAEQLETQQYLRKLLNWRKSAPVISSGKLMHFAPFDGMYVYFRYNADQLVMVVLNKNQQDTKLDVTRFAEIIKGKRAAVDVIRGNKSIIDEIVIAGRSASIFELK